MFSFSEELTANRFYKSGRLPPLRVANLFRSFRTARNLVQRRVHKDWLHILHQANVNRSIGDYDAKKRKSFVITPPATHSTQASKPQQYYIQVRQQD